VPRILTNTLLVLGVALIMATPAAAEPAAVGERLVLSAPWPAAFTFDANGRIFYGERFTGEIRIYDPATQNDTLFYTLPDVQKTGEQGLLGLALHPRYPTRPFVYAYYTRGTNGVENAIVRLTDAGGVGSDLKTIITVPAAASHNGGVIHFGPDRRLYAVVGENGNSANAQNLATKLGKVLRMTATGGVPSDNPFPGSVVWSYGLRNSFGFAFDPQTGNLWETENGPTCNDELNRIVAGGNFAWGPSWTCSGDAPQNTNQDGPEPRFLPLAFYAQTIAPTGAAFCQGCGLGAAVNGRLVFGDYNNGDVHAVTLTADRLAVASQTVIHHHSTLVLAVERAPDRTLYFSDSTGIFQLVRT
jgi:glucose/arabinose dehydrogenase